MKWCDLHSHTVYSDGRDSPQALVSRARAAGCSALAVTDHDSVAGLAEILGESDGGMEIVPGIELSCRAGPKEVHVLGLFIDPASPELLTKTGEWKKIRGERIAGMLERLRASGVRIEMSDVAAQVSGEATALGRPHVARALVALGVVSSVKEAFSRFLSRGKPGWVERPMISVAEGIALIHRAGGKASVAHPGLYGLDSEFKGFKESGLDAVEVLHTDHKPSDVRRYEKIRAELDLAATGGSDDHGAGAGKGNIGEIRAPLEWLEALRP